MTGSLALLWLVACGGGDAWTEAGALAPTWRALDADGDGRVDQYEYEARASTGAPFAAVDVDHDGTVSLDELDVLFLAADPSPQAGRRPGKPDPGPTTTKSSGRSTKGGKANQRPGSSGLDKELNPVQKRKAIETEVRLVLHSLAEEVQHADPARMLPDEEAVEVAVNSGSLHSAASRGVLAALEQAATDAHLPFPPSLSAAALAHVPVAEPLPPLPAPVPPQQRLQRPREPGGTGSFGG